MSTPHQSKANGKGYDWDDEFGCSEDTSLSCSLPLPLNGPQSITLDGFNEQALVRVIVLCVSVCVCMFRS